MFKCLNLESRRIKADNKNGTNHKATMSGVAVFVFVPPQADFVLRVSARPGAKAYV